MNTNSIDVPLFVCGCVCSWLNHGRSSKETLNEHEEGGLWNVNFPESRYVFLRIVGGMFCLLGVVSLVGCVHIQMNTHIESSGRCVRSLAVSMPAEWADALKGAGIRTGVDPEMALAEEERWEEAERTMHGRYHRLFIRRFPDPEAMSDRMIEARFGSVVQKPKPVDSDEMELMRGDRVHVGMKKQLLGTTFVYEETIQLESRSDVQRDLVRVEAEVAMPGKIVQSNAHRMEGHRAIWSFQIADGKGFVSLSATSRTSHLPVLIPMGLLIVAFVIFLPRQFFPKHGTAGRRPGA